MAGMGLPALNGAIKVRRVTVEITNDMPSYSISKDLPWLVVVGRERPTLMPRAKIRPGEGVKKPAWTPLEKVGPDSFSTELHR